MVVGDLKRISVSFQVVGDRSFLVNKCASLETDCYHFVVVRGEMSSPVGVDESLDGW